MPDSPDAIDAALNTIAAFITRYAITLAGLGVLTMAILEAAKKVFNLRQLFQRNALQAWIGQHRSGRNAAKHYTARRTAAPAVAAETAVPTYAWARAYAELLHLTTGLPLDDKEGTDSLPAPDVAFSRNVGFALYELELPQLMGQLQEAADAALNHPQLYPNWFAFLTRGCAPADVERWRHALAGPPADGPPADRERQAVGELYARMRMLVRRQLDTFQTITAYRWREWNQLYAWILGAALMFAAQVLAAITDQKPLPNLAMMIAVSLLGGLLAPVAKDLVDALSKMKR
jgi:hypothetical protein